MAKLAKSEVKLISHSPVLYWWPAWVSAFLVALTTYAQGTRDAGPNADYIHPSNNPGLIFITIVALLIIFTNAKLRGVYSLLTMAVIAFFVVLFAWLGWWDQIFSFIPTLSARANAGFDNILRQYGAAAGLPARTAAKPGKSPRTAKE